MFDLDAEEMRKLNDWRNEHDKTCRFADLKGQGAIGGRLTYCFTPTTLGRVAQVKCACGKEIDLTNYYNW